MTSSSSCEERLSFKQLPSYISSSDESSDESSRSVILSKRKANIYDAVAERVTQAGFLGNITHARPSRQPLRPDEVLFGKIKAPIRFEETDYYYAHAKLPADQPLPSGDLLSAIQAYISKLYYKTEQLDSSSTWKCMDETALIAFGILMEETAREVLGETGDLAFTEAGEELEEEIFSSEDEDEEDQEKNADGSELNDERMEDRSFESEPSSDHEMRSSTEYSEED